MLSVFYPICDFWQHKCDLIQQYQKMFVTSFLGGWGGGERGYSFESIYILFLIFV